MIHNCNIYDKKNYLNIYNNYYTIVTENNKKKTVENTMQL